MLLNLNKQTWMDSLGLERFSNHCDRNQECMENMLKLAKLYKKVNSFCFTFSKAGDYCYNKRRCKI